VSKLSKRALIVGGGALAVVAGAGVVFMGTRNAEAAVETGAPAPAFSVQDANGAIRTLAEFRGRTVVLEWTNNGCPYVRKHYDSGNMQALQREATADGVVWLQVISSAPGEQGYLDGAGALARVRTDNAAPTARATPRTCSSSAQMDACFIKAQSIIAHRRGRPRWRARPIMCALRWRTSKPAVRCRSLRRRPTAVR
jgi:hypothetical protein